MKTVTLTQEEIDRADAIGRARHNENLAVGRQDAYGAKKKGGLQLHFRGARGEYAVAKMLGISWTGNLSDLQAADVGPFQVRTTKHSAGRLILHPKDDDEDVFFLVIDRSPEFKVMGWIEAASGKQEQFWSDPTGNDRHAYFVPQGALNPLAALRRKSLGAKSSRPR